MSRINFELHYLQKEVLKSLSTNPEGLKFSSLMIEGLESEHMNYHLKKLVELRFVNKKEDLYLLSDQGKDYINSLDDDYKFVEKQPKTSILIRGLRKNSESGEIEHLLSRRLKHPYYGKIGKIGGKVRFGETLVEAAKRELYEETGLTAKNFELEEVYHKLRYRDNGEYIQDVIFYIFLVTDFEGTFIDKTAAQENLWLTQKEALNNKEYDMYDDLEFNDEMKPKVLKLVESVGAANGY